MSSLPYVQIQSALEENDGMIPHCMMYIAYKTL